MKLVDLGIGKKITLEAHLGKDSIPFDSSVKYIKKGGIVISPIRYGGKVVNLKSGNLDIHVVYDNGKGIPIVWTRCKVQQIIYKNKLQHLVTCLNEGVSMNRRGSTRVQVSANGRVTGKAGNIFAANVHDVSETGFSFVTQHEISNFVNYPLILKFDDNDMNLKFNIKGRVVRREQLADDLFLYGCEITANVAYLSRYILQKRRKERVYDLSKGKRL